MPKTQDRTTDSNLSATASGAYDRLKSLILSNKIRPNKRLMPAIFANLWDMSVTPVRDAMLQLAAERIIVRSERGGYYLPPYDHTTVCDLLSLMTILVSDSLRGMRGVATQEHCSVPGVLLDPDAPAEAQALAFEQIFMHLAKFANNSVLSETVKNALDRTHVVRVYDYQNREGVREAIEAIKRASIEADVDELLRVIEDRMEARKKRVPHVIEIANHEAQGASLP